MRAVNTLVKVLFVSLGAIMLKVFVRQQEYHVIRSPDPLIDAKGLRCMALPDLGQHVIWLDPEVSADAEPVVLHEVSEYLYRRHCSHRPAAPPRPS